MNERGGLNLTPDWPAYAMEAVGLFGFVVVAGLVSIVLNHPDLPVMHSFLKDFPFLRRIPLGIIMGGYLYLVSSQFGKRSGAHINPSVTWAFYRLGKINLRDAIVYTIAQFLGAVAASLLLKATLGEWFGHPPINYGATAPEPPHGSMEAFVAEALISFILMAVILVGTGSRRLEKWVPALVAGLIMVFLVVETPFSGMSMNPARSFAGDLVGQKWAHLWIYFLAPTAAMLLAAELFLQWNKIVLNNKGAMADRIALPVYPIPKKSAR